MARSRSTTSEGHNPTRVSSPHAAAATRRFLAVNSSITSRTAGKASAVKKSAAVCILLIGISVIRLSMTPFRRVMLADGASGGLILWAAHGLWIRAGTAQDDILMNVLRLHLPELGLRHISVRRCEQDKPEHCKPSFVSQSCAAGSANRAPDSGALRCLPLSAAASRIRLPVQCMCLLRWHAKLTCCRVHMTNLIFSERVSCL